MSKFAEKFVDPMMSKMRAIPDRRLLFLWAVFLFSFGLVIYLPKPNLLGLYNDDWYLMYDAKVMGIGFFKTIFAIDRPLRASLQSLLYTLFGDHVLYYQYSALITRVLGAVFFGAALQLAFKRSNQVWSFASFLFFIYPGFLSQPNAIDYHAHLVSLTLAMASIYLFLKSLTVDREVVSIGLAVISTLLTGLYLGLMEYYLGIEILKFGLGLFMTCSNDVRGLFKNIRQKLTQFIFLLIGGSGFLFWRVFLFESERKATDISLKLDLFSAGQITNLVNWVLKIIVNFFNALISAWVVPFYQFAQTQTSRQLLSDLAWFAISLIILGLIFNQKKSEPVNNTAVLVGVFGIIGAVFPVVFAGRSIDFGDYSRYTLPAIASVSLVLAIGLSRIDNRVWRIIAIAVLTLFAIVTHRANFQTFVDRTAAERNFWWQVSWRIPSLPEGVTLIVDHPKAAIQEDYFIWGPANFIYSEQRSDGEELVVPINGLVLNQENLNLALAGRGQIEHYRRGNQTYTELSDVLVLSQATPASCVRLLNKDLIEFSEFTKSDIRLLSSISDPSLIADPTKDLQVPVSIFGLEPKREWCYAYQKAEEAAQREDWNKVIAIGKEALVNGFYPNDRSEWFPFVRANVMLGNVEEVREIGKRFSDSKFLRQMACEHFVPIAPNDQTKEQVVKSFCD